MGTWEWRAFSEDRALVQSFLPIVKAKLTPEGVLEGESVAEPRTDAYFDLGNDELGLKLRDIRSDEEKFELKTRTKELRGLELWQKVIREPFPVSRKALEPGARIEVLAVLGEYDQLSRQDCLDRFGDWAHEVFKRRAQHEEQGVTFEVAEGRIDDEHFFSILVEGEDPEAVLRIGVERGGLRRDRSGALAPPLGVVMGYPRAIREFRKPE